MQELTDRAVWRRRRGLAAAAVHPLQQELAQSLADRLAGICREFPHALLLGASRPVAEHLARRAGGRTLLLADGSPALAGALRAFGLPVVLDEEALPVAPGWADLVVGALTLHRANDLVGALVQLRHCLRPDGLLLAALFGGGTLQELRECLVEAEVEVTGGAGLRILPMAGIRGLGDVLQRAGFALPVVDAEATRVSYPDLAGLLRDLRHLGEPAALAAARPPLRREVLRRAEALLRARYPGPEGGLRVTFEILHLCGWAPAAGQPQPLRPGSATARLADALATRELAAGERAGG